MVVFIKVGVEWLVLLLYFMVAGLIFREQSIFFIFTIGLFIVIHIPLGPRPLVFRLFEFFLTDGHSFRDFVAPEDPIISLDTSLSSQFYHVSFMS